MVPTMASASLPVTRIAVIGAGAAGITQAKQIVDAWTTGGAETGLHLDVFEARDKVGGVW
jgi:cation diffusion facilitator CzcD-associated flavoprotein CzcO